MELKVNFIIGFISTICVGVITNYIYDKIKDHSSNDGGSKSGLEFELKIKFKKK